MNLSEFIKAEKPRKNGKLDAYREQIEFLNSKGYSYAQIAKWLELQNVHTCSANVRYFLKKIRGS